MVQYSNIHNGSGLLPLYEGSLIKVRPSRSACSRWSFAQIMKTLLGMSKVCKHIKSCNGGTFKKHCMVLYVIKSAQVWGSCFERYKDTLSVHSGRGWAWWTGGISSALWWKASSSGGTSATGYTFPNQSDRLNIGCSTVKLSMYKVSSHCLMLMWRGKKKRHQVAPSF